MQITSAAAYLKKSLCVNVSIPKDAQVSLKEENGAEENELADHETVYLKSQGRCDRDGGEGN